MWILCHIWLLSCVCMFPSCAGWRNFSGPFDGRDGEEGEHTYCTELPFTITVHSGYRDTCQERCCRGIVFIFPVMELHHTVSLRLVTHWGQMKTVIYRRWKFSFFVLHMIRNGALFCKCLLCMNKSVKFSLNSLGRT